MKLDIIDLKKSYGDFSVSLNFSVGVGETLALVGPSGSGKTTALNLISGLANSESGSLISGDEDITALPCWQRNISVVFQDLALFPHLDAGQNIAYGLFIRKVPKKERQRIVDEMLELVRLEGFAKRRLHTLSGGERQRIAIARALASKPRALLLDEPFSSLDAPLRSSLRRDFLEMKKGALSNVPCIFVTHDQGEAVMLGDRVALMSAGNIVESASGRELLLNPQKEFTARFFGAGQILPGDFIDLQNPDPSAFLFVPNDAISLEPINGWKKFIFRFSDAFFEGSTLRLCFTSEYRGKTFSLDVLAGVRTELPIKGSEVDIYINIDLVSSVLG